jgi:flagellar biosynthetic protein FliR
MAIGLWPHLTFDPRYFPSSIWGLLLILFGELTLGLVLSLAIRCFFAAIQTAGQIIGFQMGFSMMSIVDPLTGTSIELTSQFAYMIALLLFLSLNGHLYLLTGFSKSFELIPPGGLIVNPKFRDCMVGTALVNYRQKLYREMGVKWVSLGTNISNRPMIKCLEKLGFTYGCQELTMANWIR